MKIGEFRKSRTHAKMTAFIMKITKTGFLNMENHHLKILDIKER